MCCREKDKPIYMVSGNAGNRPNSKTNRSFQRNISDSRFEQDKLHYANFLRIELILRIRDVIHSLHFDHE